MKKLISVILALTMLVSLCSIGAIGGDEEFIPIIFVPGYSGTQLFRVDTGENVWGITVDGVLAQLTSDFPALITGLTYMTEGEAYKLGESIGVAGVDMLSDLKCNPDGTPTVELEPHSVKAEYNSFTYLSDNDLDNFIHEREFQKDIAEVYGGDRLFSFQVDFRQGAIGCAEDLRAYVEDVKAYTGCDKVRLFGISHGGQVTGTYMSMYGTLGDVEKAIMTVPALGGTSTAVSALTASSNLNQYELIKFLELALGGETDFARILETTRIEVLDALLEGFFTGLRDVFMYWGSIWDFIPAADYDALKAEYLDPVESALLIQKSDEMHYNIMTGYNERFTEAQAAGVDVAIHASSGSEIAFGGEDNSDIIINTASVSGAKCAPLGLRFSDGYTCTGTNCTDATHNHLSPSMEIDASYAYLPDYTWFTDGQFHGMYIFDEYTTDLTWKLLMTDEITDVYSDPAFPQFEISHNGHDGIHAKMDVSSTGFLTGADSAVVVTNLSEKYPVKITAMYFDGLDIDFNYNNFKTEIPVGGSLTIPFTGEVPEVSASRTALYIDYTEVGNITANQEKVFDITIDNGVAPEYNADEPYTDVDTVDALSAHVPSELYDIFSAIGLKTDLTVLFNMLSDLYTLVEKFMVMFG